MVSFNALALTKVQKGLTPYPGYKPSLSKRSCYPVDLTPKMGPVRDQEAGSCYAYAAIELLNYGQEKTYSALYLAHMHNVPNTKIPLEKLSGLNGGIVLSALKVAFSKGLCEEAVPSKNHQLIIDYYMKKKKLACSSLELSDIILHPLASLDKFLIKSVVHETYPNLDPAYVEITYNRATDPNAFFNEIATSGCKGRVMKGVPIGKSAEDIRESSIIVRTPDGKFISEHNRVKLVVHLNSALDNQFPVAVTVMSEGMILPPNENGEHNSHALTVVGRQWNNGSCYYLLKNSWGTEWKVQDGLKAINTEKPGHILVSEKNLMEHTDNIISLDNQKIP